MNSLSSPQTDSIIKDESLVSIYATDMDFVNPLREYFETCNYRVALNDEGSFKAIYHIIAGDVYSVKYILERSPKTPIKRLVIVWNIGRDEISSLPVLTTDKIILNPPDSLTSRDVSDFLSFFFSSGQQFCNLGRTRKTTNEHPPIIKNKLEQSKHHPPTDFENVTEYTSFVNDQKRIEELLHSAYPKNSQNNSHSPFYKNGKAPANPFLFFMRVMLSTIFFFLIPILWSVLSIFVSGLTIAGATKGLISGNLRAATVALSLADFSTETGKSALVLTSLPLQGLGLSAVVRNHERIFTVFTLIIQSTKSSLSIYKNSQDLSKNLMPSSDASGRERETSIPSSLQKIMADISFIKTNLSLSSAEMSSMTKQNIFPFSLSPIHDFGITISNQLGTLNKHISSVEKVLEVYSRISGFTSERKYLVLLQNSSELRPTGGFIGSVGIVTFRDGVIRALDIHDVYDIDGQLKGHVDPPLLVNAFLGQEHWYLRDSNWDPDFSVSAQQAAFFYEKSTGTPVDGVIAINTLFLTDVLKVLGPIELSDYNEHITADNFFGKSLYYTQQNFFPGSTQKRDFLGSLTRALTNQVNAASPAKGLALFQTLTKNLTEKNILLYMNDATIMDRIREYGWGGELSKIWGCTAEDEQNIPCLSDYVFINEANLGINKVNNFIKKEDIHTVAFTDTGEVEESETITYENPSQIGTDGGGAYLPYFRLYIPNDTVIDSVTVNGKTLEKNNGYKDLRKIPYYTNEEQERFRILGIVFQIEPGTTSRIFVRYRRSLPLVLQPNIGVYELYIQKQPGQKDIPVAISLTYPNQWKITQAGEGERNEVKTIVGQQSFLANEGRLEYNGNLTQDMRLKAYVSN